MSICFMCGLENDDKLERSSLPKELMDLNAAGDLAEDFQPICKKCNDFRKIVDSHFITLCEDAKLFEWYRSDSKKRGVYYPPTFIYNISIDRLIDLYYILLDVCEDAHRIVFDDKHRQDIEDELNYTWRKKDE